MYPEQLGMLIREVKAHNECIVSLNSMDLDDGGLISCSLDKRVRVWSTALDLWGTLNQKSEMVDKSWNFPLGHKRKQKEQEISQVKELLAEVEIDPTKNLIFKDLDSEGNSKNVT